jgi:hypothetical protein
LRAGVVALALAVMVGLAGCSVDGTDRDPMTAEGRACQAIQLEAVQAALGVRFDFATGARVAETYTCVLANEGQPYPDLTLAMSETPASALVFRTSLTPSGATQVADLGRGAYQLAVAPATAGDGTASGPGVEIGWLSAAPRLVTLRYTWAAGATEADVATLTQPLLGLAISIEQALVNPAPL